MGTLRGSAEIHSNFHPMAAGVFFSMIDRHILFYPRFIHLTGSVNAALMLSFALSKQSSHDEWFCMTTLEWKEAVGLARMQQECARKKLRKAGVWNEELRGCPARLWFNVGNSLALALANSDFAYNQRGAK